LGYTGFSFIQDAVYTGCTNLTINTYITGFWPAINAMIPLYTPLRFGIASILYVPVLPGSMVREPFPPMVEIGYPDIVQCFIALCKIYFYLNSPTEGFKALYLV
jgi:hypothetical protein